MMMSKAREEELEGEYEELVYAISHDLRAPLRSVIAVAEWIKTDYGEGLDERGLDLLEMMEGGSRRLAVKFERLVDFGRSHRIVEPYPVAMDAVVERLRQRYPDANFWLSGDEVALVGEPASIEKLFDEVVSNACYFSNKETPEIQIVTEDVGDAIRVRLTDDGPGLLPDEADNVFRLFYTRLSEDVEGKCGMGLPICQRIATAHDATIQVSEPDLGGVCVEILWPITDVPDSEG